MHYAFTFVSFVVLFIVNAFATVAEQHRWLVLVNDTHDGKAGGGPLNTLSSIITKSSYDELSFKSSSPRFDISFPLSSRGREQDGELEERFTYLDKLLSNGRPRIIGNLHGPAND